MPLNCFIGHSESLACKDEQITFEVITFKFSNQFKRNWTVFSGGCCEESSAVCCEQRQPFVPVLRLRPRMYACLYNVLRLLWLSSSSVICSVWDPWPQYKRGDFYPNIFNSGKNVTFAFTTTFADTQAFPFIDVLRQNANVVFVCLTAANFVVIGDRERERCFSVMQL